MSLILALFLCSLFVLSENKAKLNCSYLPNSPLRRFQSVQMPTEGSSTTRDVAYHVSGASISVHWLSVRERITFKVKVKLPGLTTSRSNENCRRRGKWRHLHWLPIRQRVDFKLPGPLRSEPSTLQYTELPGERTAPSPTAEDTALWYH